MLKIILKTSIVYFLIVAIAGLTIFSFIPNKKNYVSGTGQNTTIIRAIPYGIFNFNDELKNVKYEISKASIVLSIIFSETVIVPVFLIGWYLYEPVSLIN